MKRFLVAAAALTLLAVTALSADMPGLPLEEIRKTVLSDNVSLQRARESLISARRAAGTKTIEGTRLSLSGGYTYTPESAAPGAPSPLKGSASLSVPIVPQLQLDGRADTNGTGSVSLSLRPFADPETTYREIANLEQSEISLAYSERDVLTGLDRAFLVLLTAERNTGAAASSLELSERELSGIREAYALGESSYDELFDAEQAVVSARKSVYTAMKNEASSRKTFAQIVGAAGAESVLPEVTLDEITALTASRRAYLAAIDGSAPVNRTLEILDIEYRALLGELDATPAFQPDLSASVSVDYPFSSVSGTVSMSLSSAQFTRIEHRDVLRAIELKKAEIAEERFGLEVEVNIAGRVVEIAEEALAAALANLERQETAYEEAMYLGSLGERTAVEVARAALSLELGRISAFSSTADLYFAQSDLAAYFQEQNRVVY